MPIRTLARLGALTTATAVLGLAVAAPAGAHVSATPSTAAAGSYTVLTMSVPHGCDGSPTTKIEIQVPESVLSVTPTRNPYYDLEKRIEELDEPLTDAHGNEVTERVASVVYTATTPLPEGQRDTFELSFQVPDVPGETLAFPTVQTCRQGRADWVQLSENGDGEELEHPAPSFEVLPAEDDGSHGSDATDATDAAAEEPGEGTTAEAARVEGSGPLSWAGLVLGGLGLLAGGTALARSRSTS